MWEHQDVNGFLIEFLTAFWLRFGLHFDGKGFCTSCPAAAAGPPWTQKLSFWSEFEFASSTPCTPDGGGGFIGLRLCRRPLWIICLSCVVCGMVQSTKILNLQRLWFSETMRGMMRIWDSEHIWYLIPLWDHENMGLWDSEHIWDHDNLRLWALDFLMHRRSI